jgi:hypothetical protein
MQVITDYREITEWLQSDYRVITEWLQMWQTTCIYRQENNNHSKIKITPF